MEGDDGSASGDGRSNFGGVGSGNGFSLSVCGDRQLFCIELRPGETTIVSWKRLIREAKKAGGSTAKPSCATRAEDSHSELQFAPDNCLQVDEPTTTYKNPLVNMGISETISRVKRRKKTMVKGSREMIENNNPPREVSKMDTDMCNPASPIYSKETTGRYEYKSNQKQNSGNCVQEESNVDGSSLNSKATLLEMAIGELEKLVAEKKPRNLDIQSCGDTASVAVKRRLPPDIKQKLAKVARLAQSSQGKISEDLINRLMSILRHLVQLRTLKRNLREMVLMGLTARREKEEKLHQLKMDLIEIIKLQPVKQEESTDDFQNSPGRMYVVDSIMEDKVFEFYDIYVQEVDEDKSSDLRKLYAELAELWPSGQMDKHGIKNAISRAKKRRRAMPDQEMVKEKGKKRIKVEESRKDLLGLEVDEKITFRMLKEQMKQQQREFESRAKKLSVK